MSIALVAQFGFARLADAQNYRVLHSFDGTTGKGGEDPYGGVVFDAGGNLYGTTHQGGIYNYGTVFELSPKAAGGWTEKVLHSFNNNGTDGCNPYAGVIVDALGNLYGVTPVGGAYNSGIVFELLPNANGSWTEKIMLTFGSSVVTSANPEGGLIADASGNLYGTTLTQALPRERSLSCRPREEEIGHLACYTASATMANTTGWNPTTH